MAMENVLKSLVRDSQALGRGFLHIKQQSQVALELLESQTGLMQSTPHELREKCLVSLHSALVSNSGHLLKLGLMGVQKLLRDNHFVSKHCDPPDDRQWLLSQLLECLSFSSWIKVSEEVQIEISKIFISFACLEHKFLNLNAHVMVDLLTRFLDMGQSGGVRSRKHQVALQTASIQNLQTFAKYIANSETRSSQNPCECDVNQAIPIIQFLCDKLEDGLATSQAFPIEFSLESIQALLSNLPDEVVLNSRSHSFVWRTLCPTLLKLVGVPCPNTPVTDYRVSELRCVASIGCELLRLFGNVSVLRAPLESLFHRLLVTDHIVSRIEMFKTIREVFSKPQRLLVIGGPFLIEGNQETFPEPNEFGILRVLFDGMEESMQTDNVELKTLVLSCANTLLTSLLSLTGTPSVAQINDNFMEKINLLYDDLESCDYIGALSYPTRLRMPKTYEQLLKDQNSHIKTPTIAIDISHLMEEEMVETINDDNSSTASGLTEGPEVVEDPEIVEKEHESSIELFGVNDGYAARSNHVDLERLAARKFLRDLQSFIPSLGTWRSPLEVDLALQQFASEYCEDAGQDHVVFNADGIYLATYVTLLLNFELGKREYYPSRSGFVTQSEEDFIASVLNSGILVYLTPEFLAELYQGVLVTDVIGSAGFNVNADSNAPMSSCAFINLLTDVRQVKCPEQATCFLSDCRKLHFAFTPNFLLREPRRQAGLKFARRLLTCFWDSFLFIYSNGVSPTSSETDNQAISQALECLQNAAKLANILGLQDRCGTIFSLLASVACGNPQLGKALVRQKSLKNRLMKARLAGLISKPIFDIDLPHILSLDVVLNKGLELASYNKEAWTHILRCCLYVTELERRVFKSRQTDRFKVTTQLKQYTSKLKWKLNNAGARDQNSDDLNLASTTFGGLEEDSGSDSYSFLTAASQLPNNDNDIQQLLDKAVQCESYRNSGQLDDKLLARIISVLSERVDLLLEDAAAKLNLKSLLLLIEELCQLCHVQLGHLGEDNISLQCHWVLHRIGEVMLRSVKTGRPLYHALHCWAIVGPTLLKAACSNDPAIAKTSVEILRSIISHVLQEQPEPRHFHFNEALFKPFEHLLCRENFDADLQDQVMSSLCELVECWSGEIRSGWRPLFACLRRWPPPPQEPTDICSSSRLIHSENISTVKEVLAAFVLQGGSNHLIFANAAMDAILCQLHYLKCYRYVAELADTALDYLQKFSKMLGQLCGYSKQTPVFYSAMSLTFLPNECDFDALIELASEHREQMEAECPGCWSTLFDSPRPHSSHAVELWDNSTGIYKVFYLLVDGVTCCLTHTKDPVQKAIGEVVMATLTLLVDIREYEFVLLCLRCSILPGMSHWLATLLTFSNGSQSGSLGTFKQVCGLLCEVMTRLLAAEETAQQVDKNDVSALFREVTLLYVQCAVQDDESLVRIGNSCLRHLIVNCGEHFESFGSELWEVAASALCLIVRCNLITVQRLIQNDRVGEQNERQQFRLQHLSQQIFNQPVAESLPPTCSVNMFVALLSFQLAINTIGNIVCYSNSILTGQEKILNQAVFAENMQHCAKVKPKILANLSSVLRNGCEFGIDFEMALGVRMHLQKLYGFSHLPSLSQVSVLSSDLLIIALTNISLHCSTHMRELEQWLDFLIDFYFQETGNNGVAPTNTKTDVTVIREFPPKTSKQSDVSSQANQLSEASKSTEGDEVDKTDIRHEDTHENVERRVNECFATNEWRSVSTERLNEDQPLVGSNCCESVNEDTREENEDSCSSSCHSSSECLSGLRTPNDEDHVMKQQMAAALESYRKQKRLQSRIINTEPSSPIKIKVTADIISKNLLLSAIHLVSLLKKNSQPSFQIVWNIMTRVSLHSSDLQIRKAHEEFEKQFPLNLNESDDCVNAGCS